MGCKDCDKEQEIKEKEYYFRIGNANILMYGCKKHIKMIMRELGGVKK